MENLFAFLAVIGLLILVHEFGHFIVAKWCNVGVLKFAIGFGPAIFRRRIGETEYQIGPIPLGGYVRMVGDMPDMITGEQPTDEAVRGEDSEVSQSADSESKREEEPALVQEMIKDRDRWFIEKGFWQRSAIVVAGPFFNFLYAFLAVGIGVFFYGSIVPLEEARIGAVHSNSPAEIAGIESGDLIEKIGDIEITSWEHLAQTVNGSRGEEITLLIKRDSETLTMAVSPKRKEIPTFDGSVEERFLMGVGPTTKRVEASLLKSAAAGFNWTLSVTLRTLEGLGGMILGKISPKELAGPVFIYKAAGEQAKEGLESLLYFSALLSVSLAVLNLLPIPVLDGGHLLIFIIEAILGPISMKKKEFAQTVGFFLLIGLMVFAVSNDITREPIEKKSGKNTIRTLNLP